MEPVPETVSKTTRFSENFIPCWETVRLVNTNFSPSLLKLLSNITQEFKASPSFNGSNQVLKLEPPTTATWKTTPTGDWGFQSILEAFI